MLLVYLRKRSLSCVVSNILSVKLFSEWPGLSGRAVRRIVCIALNMSLVGKLENSGSTDHEQATILKVRIFSVNVFACFR